MGAFFTQKQGKDDRLDGRLTAYAIVTGSTDVPPELSGMIPEGSNVFAVQADCRHEPSMNDFFKSELGSNLKKGLDQVIDKLRESGLWNEKNESGNPGEDMDMMHGMAELIPIMARIVAFESEEDVLRQEGDIYYLGGFSSFQAASMCAQAFSLLYQFHYKEQEKSHAQKSIEDLLSTIENQVPDNETFKDCRNDLDRKLMGTYVPAILYSRHNKQEYQKAVGRFRRFMEGYRFPDDIDQILTVADRLDNNNQDDVKRLGLLLDKVSAMCNEDFGKLAKIQKDLEDLSPA